MQNYIFSVISFSAVGTLAFGLLPIGDETMRKAFSLLMSLIMILVVGAPIISFVKSYDGTFFEKDTGSQNASYEYVWFETLETITKNDLDIAVLRLLSEEYSLKESEIEVDCTLKKEENAFVLDSVSVILSGKGRFINPGRVESFLNSELGCRCIVK